MAKIYFEKKIIGETLDFFQKNKERKILNFLNQNDVYNFGKEKIFRKALEREENVNFIDGFVTSKFLSLTNLKRVSRTIGPEFTKRIISSPEISKNKKHFFIGPGKEDLKKLQKKFPHLIYFENHEPPFIQTLEFPEKEIDLISKRINKFKPDIVWVGIGSPKQNILSNSLFDKTNAKYFVNIGAALDFLLGKKKEAPLFFRKTGIEWLYRFVTDFKYSKKKVWRSLVAVFYLPKYVRLKK